VVFFSLPSLFLSLFFVFRMQVLLELAVEAQALGEAGPAGGASGEGPLGQPLALPSVYAGASPYQRRFQGQTDAMREASTWVHFFFFPFAFFLPCL